MIVEPIESIKSASCVLSNNKQAIADAFGRAARSYDANADFQRQVGHLLLNKLDDDLKGLRVLDLGCGTGYFSQLLAQRGAQVTCADLSMSMLQQAQERCGNKVKAYQQADAENLPFLDNQFDMVFSSLAVQWCADLTTPLQEMRRVTKSSGKVVFSTLLDGSLGELKQAWSSIDAYQHVNDFITLNRVNIALAQIDKVSHHLDLPSIKLWYDTAFQLMRELKGIGATHVNGRFAGLTQRSQLQQVERQYRLLQNTQGLLPATYKVCLGVIQL